MFQLTVLYGQPQDTEAFDRYYEQTARTTGAKDYRESKVLQPQKHQSSQECSPYYT